MALCVVCADDLILFHIIMLLTSVVNGSVIFVNKNENG